LFGVTYSGGSTNAGTVFELSETGQTWTETVLYTFPAAFKGGFPLDIDMRNGRIYGVAAGVGSPDVGTVFELKQRGGVWHAKTIYAFTGKPDGETPSNIKFVGSTLYGTTQRGGTSNVGTIFKLVRQKAEKPAWQETIVHDFGGAPDDGNAPLAALTWDPKAGVLYGVTVEGGQNDRGTVYQFEP
ncbi:MAG TPA: choice-of-anchor tandem repeat GloVer-containing protein, partial [Rhizomicrobium sp.]|nr:choice-of-anchor tandem repeat GloVer-containing protein [Rhizomicrobium sp.]